jgi:hypothetical protein
LARVGADATVRTLERLAAADRDLRALTKRTSAGLYQHGSDPKRLWIRPLNSLDARPIAGTDDADLPFWSPDEEHLAFFAQGKLKKVAVTGGPAETLCDAPTPRGGIPSANGQSFLASVLTDGTMAPVTIWMNWMAGIGKQRE